MRASDRLAMEQAKRIYDRFYGKDSNQCSNTSGTWAETIFANQSDYAAISSFTTETSLLKAGPALQPVIPAFLLNDNKAFGRTLIIVASGVLGTTGTPSYTFQARLGTTSGPSFISGTSVGVSAAIVTSSGVSNKWWQLWLALTMYTPGIGSSAGTLSGSGYVQSPGGFASPFVYPLEPSTPDTATWTSTIDCSVTQYFNLSVTSTASSSSNTLTLKQLLCFGMN